MIRWLLASALRGPVLWNCSRQPYKSVCMNGSVSFVSHLFCSLERSIRFQQVHQLHDELDLGLKKWQDQILALQRKATRQAEAKATHHLDSKRQKVENENRARWLHHTHLMDRSVNHDVLHGIYITPHKLLGNILNVFLCVIYKKSIKIMHNGEVMSAQPSTSFISKIEECVLTKFDRGGYTRSYQVYLIFV